MNRAGIDPGSAYVGLVISQGDAAPLRALHRERIEVGEMVPLKVPRTGIRQTTGVPWEQTHRRSVNGEHVDAVTEQVVLTCQMHRVRRAIIEHVDNVFLDGLDPKAHSSVATQLARSAWLEGSIRKGLRAIGVEVIEARQASVRARVAGRSLGKRGGSSPERIPDAVCRGFPDWPAESDQHERDAALLCLFDVMPELDARIHGALAPCTCSTKGAHIVGCARLGGGPKAGTSAKQRHEDLLRWRLAQIPEAGLEGLVESLSVEGLPYQQTPAARSAQVTAFRRLRHDQRINIARRVLAEASR